jgi:hypothetical protein
MALAVEWLPEEWPDGIPSLKQLLVVAPLTIYMLLLLVAKLQPPLTILETHTALNEQIPCRGQSLRMLAVLKRNLFRRSARLMKY